MRHRLPPAVVAAATVLSALVVVAAHPASAVPVSAFSNTASIALSDPGAASVADATPYPSNITVSGLSGTITGVTVTLSNVSYLYSQDISTLLVSPSGVAFKMFGGVGPSSGSTSATHANVTISDAGTLPSASTAWAASQTWKPFNHVSFFDTFGPPAPTTQIDAGDTGSGPTMASAFGGGAPNGTWSLYVITTSSGDGTGAIAGGWSISITTANAAASSTTLASSNNPSFTGAPNNSVSLTAAVTSTGTVNEGTVGFTDGGTPIAGCSAVAVVSGQAVCSTSFATEGDHALKAQYNGTANFAPSSATLTQHADSHTTVTGSSYCNAGSIALLNPPVTLINANPYPSKIFTSGLAGTVNHLSVTLKNVSYQYSQDIDVLLVGPGGQSLILVANLGPNTAPAGTVSGSNLTVDDAGILPVSGATTAWGANPTFKPVDYGGPNETFGPPAPSSPTSPGSLGTGATLASVFNGSNPDGTWSLYVITTSSDGTGAIGGGWCVNLTSSGSTAATTTSVSSDNNPSFTASPGNAVTLTASVQSTSLVNEGTVAFTDAGTPIPGCTAVAVVSGAAQCPTSFTAEGDHLIQAHYNGTANFGAGNATLHQTVNRHTTVTGSSFCNAGSIALQNPPATVADANPYPSNVFVTGRPGAITHLSVRLLGVSYGLSQDISALLVGPGGQTLILVSDLGPNTAPAGTVSGSNLTLDDTGTLPASQTTAWGASPTFKPVNYVGLNQVWGPPAPPGPLGDPGTAGTGATLSSTFNGTAPNGTWALYVITTSSGGGTGAIAGGWCLDVTTPLAPGLTASFTPTTVAVNGSSTLSFTVTNPNPSTSLTGVGFTDSLPSGVVVSTPNALTGSCGGGLITATAGSSSVSLAGATLAANASCTFSIGVTASSPGVKTDTTSAPTSTEGGSGTPATATLTVAAAPTLTKSFGASSIPVGGSTSLSFTATNPNNSVALTGVGFSDPLPAGLVVATPNALTGSCGGGTITATAGSASVTVAGAALAAGAGCTFSVNLTATSVGPKVNTTSTISSIEGGSGGAATAGITVGAAPPQITKSFGSASVPLNGSTSLSFTISDAVGNADLTGVGFTDNLPAGLVVSTPNGLSGTCGGGTISAAAGGSSVGLTNAALAAGASCTFSVAVTGTGAGVKNNSVSVTSTNGGTGNTSNASLTVVAPPTITKAFGAASIPFNGSTSLSFTLTNPNLSTALTGVGFNDAFPSGLVVSTPNGLSGTCGGGAITATSGTASAALTGATLAASASCTFSVNVTGTTGGVKNNSVTVTSTEGGTGNTSNASLTVVLPASKVVIITAPVSGPASSTASLGPITVQLQDTNGNPVAAPGNVTVQLSSNSAGVAVFSATHNGPATTAVTIPTAATSTSFFYGDTRAGTPTITAAVSGLTSATQTETILGGSPVAMTFLSAAVSGPVNAGASLGPITVGLLDAFGNPAAAPAGGTTISLVSASTGSYLFATTAGGTPVTTVKVPAGAASAHFFYGDSTAGTPVITASAPGLGTATQQETITPVTFTATVGHTSSPYVIFFTNTTSSVVAIGQLSTTNPVFVLQADACSGHSFAAGASCRAQVVFKPTTTGTQTGQVVIPASSGTLSLPLTGTA